MGHDGAESDCGCKLWRVAGDRGLQETVTRLEDAWRDRSASLREFEREFNRAVLDAALESAGYIPLDGEADNLYRLLTDDAVTGGMRTQARGRLEDRGIDVDALLGDFVSYQTVNRHLKGCRSFPGRDRTSPLAVDDAEDRLFALRNRTAEVTRQTVGQLDQAGTVDLGEFEVYVDIGVSCTDCGTQLDLVELFSRWRCRCPGFS